MRAFRVLSTTKRRARSRSCPAASMIASSRVTSLIAFLSSARAPPISICKQVAEPAPQIRRVGAQHGLSLALQPIDDPCAIRRFHDAVHDLTATIDCRPTERRHLRPPAVGSSLSSSGHAPGNGMSRQATRTHLLGLASDTANDLLDRRVAFEHGEQPAVEDRPHAALDCGALDRGVVGAVKDQPVGRAVRHQ